MFTTCFFYYFLSSFCRSESIIVQIFFRNSVVCRCLIYPWSNWEAVKAEYSFLCSSQSYQKCCKWKGMVAFFYLLIRLSDKLNTVVFKVYSENKKKIFPLFIYISWISNMFGWVIKLCKIKLVALIFYTSLEYALWLFWWGIGIVFTRKTVIKLTFSTTVTNFSVC